MADNGPVQPAVPQVDQVLNRILGAGKNDEVGVFQVAGIFRIAQAAARLKGQGLEIGKVGNMAELHHGNINISCTALAAETLRLRKMPAIRFRMDSRSCAVYSLSRG